MSERASTKGRDDELASASYPQEPIDVAAWRKAMEGVTPGPWRLGTDLARVNTDYLDASGNSLPSNRGKGGWGKTICTIGYGGWAPEDEHYANGRWIGRCSPASVAALLDEIERLRQVVGDISAALGTVRFMDPLDGGDVSLAEQVRRMREALEKAEGARND